MKSWDQPGKREVEKDSKAKKKGEGPHSPAVAKDTEAREAGSPPFPRHKSQAGVGLSGSHPEMFAS